jgi:hypothetical protein
LAALALSAVKYITRGERMQEVAEFTKVQAEDRHGLRQAQFIDGSSCTVFYYRIKRIVDLIIAIPARQIGSIACVLTF